MHLEALDAYDWPGNVRELVNVMDRALTVGRDASMLFSHHLSTGVRAHMARRAIADTGVGEGPGARGASDLPCLKEARTAAITRLESDYLGRLMNSTTGNVKEACRIAGASRSQLYNLLKKYCLKPV